ncbi:hypothetical protein D3C76_756880 [compost metagenome]
MLVADLVGLQKLSDQRQRYVLCEFSISQVLDVVSTNVIHEAACSRPVGADHSFTLMVKANGLYMTPFKADAGTKRVAHFRRRSNCHPRDGPYLHCELRRSGLVFAVPRDVVANFLLDARKCPEA